MNTRTTIWILKTRSVLILKVLVLCTSMLISKQTLANNEANTTLLELTKQLKQLKDQQLELEKKLEEFETAQLNSQQAVPSTKTSNNDLLKLGLSGLFSSGYSSVKGGVLENLQAGGHDPNRNGFTVQNVELSINSTVDPYFDAQANFVFQIDTEGETVVELEEAFFITRSLPWGLQVKGGQYFTEFGRLNPQHPHSWAFVDQPVVLSRLFGGDGLRGQGARVSWLMPTWWYSELSFGGQNAKGETVTSFLSVEGEEIAGHILRERQARNFGDLLYSARWLNSFDLSDNTSMNLGFSGLTGPNASGGDNDTTILGTDLYLKWQADYTQRGFPFVSWHTEWLSRRYEAGEVGSLNRETLTDSGVFTQVLWGFEPRWVAGLRLEYADANGDNPDDPLRDNRKRLAANLTWHLTEFSKLRLQYNRDWTQHLDENNANSLWLQLEFSLGSHMAHKF